MAISIEMLIAVHSKATNKVNLTYVRPGGKKIGYCYIDPKQPLQVSSGRERWAHNFQDALVENYIELLKFKDQEPYFSFYKQDNGVKIMLKLSEVSFQNKNREELLKLIYANS